MNNLVQKFFLYVFSFYPLVAWGLHFVINKPINFILTIALLPVAIYFLSNNGGKRLPKYLLLFIGFTLYHLASSFINNTIPVEQNKVFFIFQDINVFACVLFIIIEHARFDEKFMDQVTKNIFIVVMISLVVSVIQIKDNLFFYNLTVDPDLIYIGEGRNSSIYSWVSINSGGITFPILVGILLNYFSPGQTKFFMIIVAGIVVAFLTRARYVMVSMIIVMMQLFFATKPSFQKIASLAVVFIGSIFLMSFVAKEMGFNIQEVISSRILEEDNEMGSAKARVTSYEVFMKVFPESPLLGVGPKTKQNVIELLGDDIPLIHVGYLSYLYYYGLVGCFFLFLSMFYLLKRAWQVGKKHSFWGSFYGLLTFCFANLTFVYYNFSELGIIMTVIYMRYYELTEMETEKNELVPVT